MERGEKTITEVVTTIPVATPVVVIILVTTEPSGVLTNSEIFGGMSIMISVMHFPQSLEQVLQVSSPLQVPSPHTGGGGQTPQSEGQVVQFSSPLQLPSPQTGGGGHIPQSEGQVTQVSSPLQLSSPQKN